VVVVEEVEKVGKNDVLKMYNRDADILDHDS